VAEQDEGTSGGSINQAIARAVAQGHSRVIGRGPTRVTAFYRHNIVVVVLEDPLTVSERSLVAAGRMDAVTEMRRQLQATMRAAVEEDVERLTRRAVLAFLSANHVDPDLAVEVFVLDGPVPADGAAADA